MIQIVWTFRIRQERRAEFLRHYSANGSWAELFSKSAAYRGTTLLQDAEFADRFLCVDRWDSCADFDNFQREHELEYSALDQHCEQLTTEEVRVGIFHV